MKKFSVLLLALLLILSMTACGKEMTDPAVEEEITSADIATETDESPVDLSTFTFGVTEEGGDVVVSVKNETEVGDVVRVMTYKYAEDALTEGLIQYYVPSEETAAALAAQLESDSAVEAGTISVDGTCVSCQIAAEQLRQLAQLTRQELIDTMKAAISDTQ